MRLRKPPVAARRRQAHAARAEGVERAAAECREQRARERARADDLHAAAVGAEPVAQRGLPRARRVDRAADRLHERRGDEQRPALRARRVGAVGRDRAVHATGDELRQRRVGSGVGPLGPKSEL